MPPEVQAYQFGLIVVDGQSYDRDLIVFPDRVRAGWWREEGHSLSVADLVEVFDAQPELLIIGRGAHGRMTVPPHTKAALEQKGIEVMVLDTVEAVERYNQERSRRRVAAALHLTC